MQGRTIRAFTCPENFWPQVERWATETGFSLACQEDSRRIYRKGHRLLMAPVWVEIRQAGEQVTLEAWIKVDFYLILSLFSGRPPETGIASGGLTAALPRRRAREAVNRLLARFDQQPVT